MFRKLLYLMLRWALPHYSAIGEAPMDGETFHLGDFYKDEVEEAKNTADDFVARKLVGGSTTTVYDDTGRPIYEVGTL